MINKTNRNTFNNKYLDLSTLSNKLEALAQRQRKAFPDWYARYESGEYFDHEEDHSDMG